MTRNIKIKRIILIIIILFLFGILNIWFSYNHLKYSYYQYDIDQPDLLETGLKLIVLADLHDHEFVPSNQKLTSKISRQSPDLILLVGDFLNDDSPDSDIPCTLIRGLKDIAPVYFSLGNHELEYMANSHPDLIAELEAAGAVVLEKEYVDLDIRGNKIRLGGMYEYAFALDDFNTAENLSGAERVFLEDFQNTDRLKLMMAHRPDSFVLGTAAEYWDIDLVISGHNHGGQVVIPFLGGLYGGDQGFFPEYIHGMYEKGKMNIFVTSGLGSDEQLLPRFNNLPEIAVLTLQRKE